MRIAKFSESFSDESCILPRLRCRSITREASSGAGKSLPLKQDKGISWIARKPLLYLAEIKLGAKSGQ